MLFPDPIAAIHEMLRVTKPGGRIAIAVWGERASNPFFHLVADNVARYVPSPPEDPDAPGAFRFAPPGKLAGLLRDAGAHNLTERVLDFSLDAEITPRQFWELRTELSDSLRSKLATLTADQIAALAQEVEKAARDYQCGKLMQFPARVLILSATR
jgi:hypothetical protein